MSTSTAGTYQLVIAVAGCTGSPNLIDATLKPTPNPPTIDPVSPVCENGTLVLSAGSISGATYSWSGPAGFVSNAQSPAISSITAAMAGNYAVNILVNGCRSANNIVNVVVNPLPAAPVLSTGGAVCVGNTLQLNAANISGASYSWTGPAGFVSNLQNPLVTNAALNNAGVYTASVTVNGCAGPTNTITAIVNPLPGAVNINSSGPACQGRPLQLTADSVVAGVYTWSGPNGFTANTRSISFASMNALLAGNYQVAVAVAGCPGASNSITTVLKPTPAAPVINTVAPICENGPLLLRLNTVTGAIYNWSGPNGFTSNAQNPYFDSVKLNRSGIYTASVTVDGCISNNSSVNINVIPEPTAPSISSNSPVCINTQLQFNAGAVAGATYKWIGENGYTSSLQNPLINTAALRDTGKYGLAVTVNGCVSDTSYLQVAVDKLAVVDAGTDQVVCANNALVNLSGTVSGGTTSGIWSTSGTGRFGTRAGSLNNTYLPSSTD
ncbi:MAG: immunoglobulin domain-containing protein, partial [Bacteroidia bacterium]